MSILLVPNYNRAYALSFGSFLAKHDIRVEFENAFIKKITSNRTQQSSSTPFSR